MAMAPPPVRWLPAVLGALLLMMTIGLGLVWWSGRKPAPPLPVMGTLPAFTLTDRSGATVTPATLAGRPWIADLVFTRCQLSCPRMTARMASLGPRRMIETTRPRSLSPNSTFTTAMATA